MSFRIPPNGNEKVTIHDPKNSHIFDNEETKLKKRKAELEKKAFEATPEGSNKPDFNRLTPTERAELVEINRQLGLDRPPTTKNIWDMAREMQDHKRESDQ